MKGYYIYKRLILNEKSRNLYKKQGDDCVFIRYKNNMIPYKSYKKIKKGGNNDIPATLADVDEILIGYLKHIITIFITNKISYDDKEKIKKYVNEFLSTNDDYIIKRDYKLQYWNTLHDETYFYGLFLKIKGRFIKHAFASIITKLDEHEDKFYYHTEMDKDSEYVTFIVFDANEFDDESFYEVSFHQFLISKLPETLRRPVSRKNILPDRHIHEMIYNTYGKYQLSRSIKIARSIRDGIRTRKSSTARSLYDIRKKYSPFVNRKVPSTMKTGRHRQPRFK